MLLHGHNSNFSDCIQDENANIATGTRYRIWVDDYLLGTLVLFLYEDGTNKWSLDLADERYLKTCTSKIKKFEAVEENDRIVVRRIPSLTAPRSLPTANDDKMMTKCSLS